MLSLLKRVTSHAERMPSNAERMPSNAERMPSNAERCLETEKSCFPYYEETLKNKASLILLVLIYSVSTRNETENSSKLMLKYY